MNEENQVYFIDSDQLPPSALERKHRLEQDPSFRADHMKYMDGMQVIESDIKDKVLKAMGEKVRKGNYDCKIKSLGNGVEENDEIAMEWFEKAAENGNEKALKITGRRRK